MTVKSKYLFFEEDTALYNTLSSSGSQDEEGEGASNPTIAANSVIGSDMFPLKIPIPTIIGVSKVVNDYSYEINLYTSNGTIHTIVFEDSSNYTNAYTQIEHAMTHKKHLNFNLLRRSSKNQHPLDYEQQQQQQQQQQVQQVQEQQKLSPTQKPEQKEIERVEGEQESVYGSPTRAGDRSYESDEDVLESHTHKKRKKHKRRKERKHTREECEALGFVCDDRCEEKGTDTHDNCGTASPPQNICEAAKDSLALHSTEPDSSESEVGGAKQNRSCGTPTKTPLICASATAASTPISCEGKKDKGEEKIVVNNSNNNGSNGDSQEYSTNAIFFVLGIIFTLLAQRIF